MPDYNIQRISDQCPEEGVSYFFDANVWIYIFENSTDYFHQPYMNFFYDLIGFIDNYKDRANLPPKLLKKAGGYDEAMIPKIILTPLLVSEMFNVMIRKRFREYCDAYNLDDYDFKKDYRGGDDYIEAMKMLRDELRNYQQYYTFNQDEADVEHILSDYIYTMDFNDQCFYYNCYDNGYILVTNDSDLKVEFVTVYTERKDLLSLMK